MSTEEFERMRQEMWEKVRADHTCTCTHDDPSLEVISTRQGPHHIGVRFWEDGTEEKQRDLNAQILLNGMVIEGVVEAILGDQGTIWRYRGVPAASKEGRHVCQTCRQRAAAAGLGKDDGTVRFEMTERGTERATPEIRACMERLTGSVELRAKARTGCEGCDSGGDASHTYAQGICTGGRGDNIDPGA